MRTFGPIIGFVLALATAPGCEGTGGGPTPGNPGVPDDHASPTSDRNGGVEAPVVEVRQLTVAGAPRPHQEDNMKPSGKGGAK
jgi:hypothetical protein